jgi:hypothetical protein
MIKSEQRHICLIFIGDIRYDGRGYNIASSLVRAGHRITFVTTGGFSPVHPLQNSEVIRIKLHQWSFSKLRFLEFYLKSIAAVLEIKADLYQADSLLARYWDAGGPRPSGGPLKNYGSGRLI